MNRIRLRLLMGATLLSGLAVLATANMTWLDRTVAAAEPMPADSPATWQSLLSDKAVEGILASQSEVIDKSMRSSGTFRRALKKLDTVGRIVAVVGNAETLRLEGDAAKKGAALRDAGLALAKATEDRDFDAATAAVESINAYPGSIKPADDSAPVKWTDLIDLDGVMMGVSTADLETKKAVGASSASTFRRSAGEAESYAMLLACLGVVARDYEPDEDWKGWCDDMREGSVAMAKAFGNRDQDASKAARDTLMKSCDECHEAFRVE